MVDTFRSDVKDPQVTTPARAVGSIRRTSHVQMSFEPDGTLVIDGVARDLATTVAGSSIRGASTIHARLTDRHTLLGIDAQPSPLGIERLVGVLVGPGFRATLNDALPEEHAASTPLFLLLDDLPVAALISGYALMYSGKIGVDREAGRHLKSDICAGWRSDGTMMVAIRVTGAMPTPVGPVAPDLIRPDDPIGWHDIGPLPAGSMRRRRLIDVGPGVDDGGTLGVFAMFRDTHADESGIETVVHEYSLTAWIDIASGTLVDCVAVPRVLPWNECPAAATSARQLDGRGLGEIREVVRRELRGTSTCTHLNDLLRSLGDLPALASQLEAGRTA